MFRPVVGRGRLKPCHQAPIPRSCGMGHDMIMNSRIPSCICACMGAALLVVVLGSGVTPGLADAPQLITSDTLDYCQQLQHKLARQEAHFVLGAPPSDVMQLADQGRHLCDQGHVRGGILRLRKALLILRHAEKAAR
ncbi:putative secreted protein [Granulibacter bethesdensis]|uniref:Secreted protein n=2 Tax=Granulibacter bethesdensis TaxID=364410 RepID=A0AAN0VGX1_9PROT|nr:putative secreted protein [Granulibacter bethesdensis]